MYLLLYGFCSPVQWAVAVASGGGGAVAVASGGGGSGCSQWGRGQWL